MNIPRPSGRILLFILAIFCLGPAGWGQAAQGKKNRPPVPAVVHAWQKVEISLEAKRTYANPYTEMVVWVDLKGPGFARRCYGFWDGKNTFRVRVLASAPGAWSWQSGSNQDDPGLNGKTGVFKAVAWTETEKNANPCRRGIVRPTANGHAFEYPDGTPFFLLADTWWPAATFRFPWHGDRAAQPMGPKAGFQDYVRFRKAQGYNGIAMIASFPNWANDDLPNEFRLADGTPLRSAWQQAGTSSAKDMTDEDGNRAFLFPGKVPGYEKYFPDVERINPAYFRNMDAKIDFLNGQGFIPFIEPARRDIGPAWKKFYPWPDSYTRYIRYIWARYQANICFFSPIHFDWEGSLPAEDWNAAANKAIDDGGPPPFGTLVSCNASGSSLENFGHTDEARWVGFHQIGNFHKTLGHGHRSYPLLTDIFNAKPPIPAINGEPYYDGQHGTVPGSATAAFYCRSAMYGSVLSGGLGGHIYGAGKEGPEGAIWNGNTEEASKFKIWDAIQWESGGELRHLRTFILSEGKDYRNLIPSPDLINPNKSGNDNDWMNWAYASATKEKDLLFLYFEAGCEQAVLSGAIPNQKYTVLWFNPRSGEWTAGRPAEASSDGSGKITLPRFLGDREKADVDWGLKLVSQSRKR